MSTTTILSIVIVVLVLLLFYATFVLARRPRGVQLRSRATFSSVERSVELLTLPRSGSRPIPPRSPESPDINTPPRSPGSPRGATPPRSPGYPRSATPPRSPGSRDLLTPSRSPGPRGIHVLNIRELRQLARQRVARREHGDLAARQRLVFEHDVIPMDEGFFEI